MIELCPPKRYVGALSPGTCEIGDLIWKWVPCRCNRAKMSSYWISVGPNPMTDVLIKRHLDIQEHQVRMKAEVGVIPCKPGNTKDHW